MLCLKHYDQLSDEADDAPCYMCKLAAVEDELAASKERIKQLYASHDRKDAKITDLRIRIENAEMLAERRKWGAEEMDRLRAKLAAAKERLIESGQAVFESQLEVQSEKRRADAAEKEITTLREDKARLLALIDEAQKDILVRSHSDVQAAIADVGRRLRAAIDKAKDGE